MFTHDPNLIAELTDVAKALADAAAVETLRHFRALEDVENKLSKGFDPVTEGDRAAEAAMRAILAERRPDDGIIGEELGQSHGSTGFDWVLDPIDGTRAYLAGAPVWGTLIAVSDSRGPVLGVIDQPHIGERFVGTPEGARYRGPDGARRISTRGHRPLAEAILLSTFPEIGTEEERAAFRRVSEVARLTRYGLDCYGYALLAMGQVDLVIEAGLNSYDIQGPMAVVQAAGGIVTTWSGGNAAAGGQVVAAANPQIHAEAIARLAG
ncbi:histidinol-phosphatase [Palleronia caenipelagi]|uniref:Histidinol-phosphatase n=1 Tax=Palleronia caenipelagi TaxID=2489174 RepID=A0A547QB39_9RHOB|nr:histidinol-phosphatase [Palleronia caenipelagi]TRD23598.1 histidinol-phosphatase [Palleronia caenipelagi]